MTKTAMLVTNSHDCDADVKPRGVVIRRTP
jgi:hypothetical protein